FVQAILQVARGGNSAGSRFLQHRLSPSPGVKQNVKDRNIHSLLGEIFGENTSGFAKADNRDPINEFRALHVSYDGCYMVRETSGGAEVLIPPTRWPAPATHPEKAHEPCESGSSGPLSLRRRCLPAETPPKTRRWDAQSRTVARARHAVARYRERPSRGEYMPCPPSPPSKLRWPSDICAE